MVRSHSWKSVLTFGGTAALLTAWILRAAIPDTSQLTENENYNGTVVELIQSYGYPVEVHDVITEDGYILTLHRIPPLFSSNNSDTKRTPVFLGHCMTGSSAIWVLEPSQSLAFPLADNGYDVWMINMRGTTYSRRHVNYTVEDPKFWDFSHHESAIYDYPAAIDFILKETGQDQVFFAGFSLGTTKYFILLSEKPEYNDKILAGFMIGPTAIGKHADNHMVTLAPLAPTLMGLYEYFGYYENPALFPPTYANLAVRTYWAKTICETSESVNQLCSLFQLMWTGMEWEGHLSPKLSTIIFTHFPNGMSTKMIVHMSQMFSGQRDFAAFDYGLERNLEVYGSAKPYHYKLEKVTAATALISAPKDGFAIRADLDSLVSRLPNVFMDYQVPKHDFNHVDLQLGMEANHYVNMPIVQKMNEISRNQDILLK